MRAYTCRDVAFEWDKRKARSNLQRHGVDFADAATIFDDQRALSMEDEMAYDEQRFVALGRDALGRLLVVVYTWREDNMRIISARQATNRERRLYKELTT